MSSILQPSQNLFTKFLLSILHQSEVIRVQRKIHITRLHFTKLCLNAKFSIPSLSPLHHITLKKYKCESVNWWKTVLLTFQSLDLPFEDFLRPSIAVFRYFPFSFSDFHEMRFKEIENYSDEHTLTTP